MALKILPEAFSADRERLARFQREAEVLASLNHPNIAAIHGLEEADDTRALVLELVEGPTLADRIKQGPIPLDEALPIAKQIAEALEAAHEAGVIHRDLKPANIKVRDDGTVKVLDFGLAKALDPSPTGDPSQSPTLTAAATQMGVIMGTAAYMSPGGDTNVRRNGGASPFCRQRQATLYIRRGAWVALMLIGKEAPVELDRHGRGVRALPYVPSSSDGVPGADVGSTGRRLEEVSLVRVSYAHDDRDYVARLTRELERAATAKW